MSTDQLFVVTYDSEQLLIEAEKAVCTIKTVNDGGRSKTSVLGCSEVIFRDAEKCRTSRHCTRKTSLHPEGGGNPLPMVADCEKPN